MTAIQTVDDGGCPPTEPGPDRRTSPTGDVLRRLAVGPVALAAAAGGALAVLGVVDPNQPGHYPTCPFLAVTGYFCPGCGSLRALHDLTHLDLAGAWGMNPLLLVVLPFLLLTWVLWVRRIVAGRHKARLLPGWVVLSIFGAFLLYGVARNVPALAPLLAP